MMARSNSATEPNSPSISHSQQAYPFVTTEDRRLICRWCDRFFSLFFADPTGVSPPLTDDYAEHADMSLCALENT